jgi:serine-type D-Ala-D-Ala carboxypeptidase
LQAPPPRRGERRYDAVTMIERDAEHSAAPPADPTVRFSGAYRVLREAIAAKAFPGCAFGVLAEGRVVLEDALGRFTYEENSPAVTAQTVFDVASVTKVASTTAAAMLLFQQGRLDLDMPVADLLPGFVVGRAPGTFARHVRLRHLLAHSSGLPGYVEFFRQHATPAGLLRACLELAMEAPPGARAEYSDPGFILLGKALEVITGEALPVWAQREVFAPLAMTASGFCPRPSSRSMIPPTENDTWFRHRIIQGEVQDENAFILNGAAGHAGLFSDVRDLLTLAREILAACGHRSITDKARLFYPATVELFAERQPPEGSTRALGWDTPGEHSSSGRHFSTSSIGHLGYSGCSLWIDRAAGIAVVLLTNRTWPDRANQSIRQVRPAFHDAVREAI